MKRKVAIYARVSTEYEAQLSALDNQVQYYDRYIDEGITGTSTKKRKNFMNDTIKLEISGKSKKEGFLIERE